MSVFSWGEGKDDMKKLTFAFACASTFALFAEIGAHKAGFEDYTEATGWKVADEYEPGTEATYWLYEEASGSEDGSTVKVYGGDNLAKPPKDKDDNPGEQYLELSTEGGTLWRSLAAGKKDETDIANKLGPAREIDPEKGLYIDTMVQFTPTEDGDSDGPKVDPSDKLAIWLNVDSSGGTPVTNLMVKAGHVYRDGSEAVDPMQFVLEGTSGVVPGTWYRLTVKAIPDVTKSIADGERKTGVTGYQILLDGQPLSTKATVFESSYIDWAYEEWLEETDKKLLQSGTVFAGLDGFVTAATLQAVGFKGSGALDNLSISETALPSSDPIAVTPQITLSATEATFSGSLALPTVTVEGSYVLDTDYTVTWSGELPTENPSEDVVLTVTVTMTGRYTGSATATFTVKPASTTGDDWKDVKDIPENAKAGTVYPTIPDTLKNADANKLTVWATDVGKVAFSDAAKINVDAFLLNVANDADETTINNAKAEFTLAITVDAKGTVTVTSPDPDGTKYNGKITIKGSKTVKDDYTLEMGANGEIPKDAKFFKAYLSVE